MRVGSGMRASGVNSWPLTESPRKAGRVTSPRVSVSELRGLAEAGLSPVSYATVKRHLPRYATEDFTRDLSRLLAGRARIGRAWLVLFDVTTLYFETDKADGFREPGLSKERRLEPQITVGLLTDETGFPLRAGAFEGNKAETSTMIPMINDFMDAYNLDDVVVVADAGMISTRSVSLLMAVVISCYSSTYSDSPILICHVTPNRSTSCP